LAENRHQSNCTISNESVSLRREADIGLDANTCQDVENDTYWYEARFNQNFFKHI